MVDGLGDVGSVVLRDRQRLSEDGIIIVVLLLMQGTSTFIGNAEIVSRGFVYAKGAEDLMDNAREVVNNEMTDLSQRHVSDWTKIRSDIRTALSDFVWKETKRRPMILPIVMEV